MKTATSRLALIGMLCGVVACAAIAGTRAIPSRGELTLSELTISDADGRERATLKADDTGVTLKMFDRRGQLAVTLGVVHDSPRDRPLLTFYDQTGRPEAVVGYPSFELEEGTPDVAWNTEMPMFVVVDGEGKATWYAPPDVVGPWDRARLK